MEIFFAFAAGLFIVSFACFMSDWEEGAGVTLILACACLIASGSGVSLEQNKRNNLLKEIYGGNSEIYIKSQTTVDEKVIREVYEVRAVTNKTDKVEN
jgi:hypothetical protein